MHRSKTMTTTCLTYKKVEIELLRKRNSKTKTPWYSSRANQLTPPGSKHHKYSTYALEAFSFSEI